MGGIIIEALVKAYKYYENRDYDNSINLCLDLYQKNYKLDKILPLLIYSHLSKGEFYNIVEYFEKYVRLNLNEIEIDMFLEESFSILDGLDFNDFVLNLNKAEFLINFEKYSEAIIYLDKIIIDKSDNTQVLNLKGFALIKLGQYEKAYDIFNKVISIDEINYNGWKFKAQILFINDYDLKAMEAFSKVLSINNNEIFIWREYISSCIFSKEYKKAINEINNALKIFPNNLDLLIDLFELYIYLEEYDNGKRVADKIADNYPDVVDGYFDGENDILNENIIHFILESKPLVKEDSFDKFIFEDFSLEEPIESQDLNQKEVDDIISKVFDSLDDDNNLKIFFKNNKQ